MVRGDRRYRILHIERCVLDRDTSVLYDAWGPVADRLDRVFAYHLADPDIPSAILERREPFDFARFLNEPKRARAPPRPRRPSG